MGRCRVGPIACDFPPHLDGKSREGEHYSGRGGGVGERRIPGVRQVGKKGCTSIHNMCGEMPRSGPPEAAERPARGYSWCPPHTLSTPCESDGMGMNMGGGATTHKLRQQNALKHEPVAISAFVVPCRL